MNFVLSGDEKMVGSIRSGWRGVGTFRAIWTFRAIRTNQALKVGLLLVMMGLGSACSGGDDKEDDPVQQNLDSYAGDFYADYLQDGTYTKLLIEIDVVSGAKPDQEAVDTLVENISMLCNKPGGIEVQFPDDTIGTDESLGPNPEYTYEAVEQLELQYRDNYTQGDTAVLYFLYLDGHSEFDNPDEGTAVLGYAYHGSSMAVFMGTILEYPTLVVQTDLVKRVTVHEFGHLIGLVNDPLDMVTGHADPDYPPHCDNSECMMYWLNSYSDLRDIVDGEIPSFDDNCLTDVAAAGGKNALGRPQPK